MMYILRFLVLGSCFELFNALKVTFHKNNSISFQDFMPSKEPDYNREVDLQKLINDAYVTASSSIKKKYCKEKTYHVVPRDIDWDPRYPFEEHKYFYLEAYDWMSDPQRRVWTGPDINFVTVKGIETYDDLVKKILIASQKSPSIEKVAWFGNVFGAGRPTDPPPYAPPEAKTRSQLLEYAAKVNDMFDFRHVCKSHTSHTRSLRQQDDHSDNVEDDQHRALWLSWLFPSSKHHKDTHTDKDTVAKIPDPECSKHVPLDEIVENYSYLLDIGGWGYSGRLKYLLFSKRPLLFVMRRYVEYFHEDLIPYHHYIPVKEDLSDLVSQAMWMMEHRDEAYMIAENAYQFAVANLTVAKAYDRAREVFISQCPRTDGSSKLIVH